MRIIIEIDGAPYQPQITVESPRALSPGAAAPQPPAGGAVNAGPAPSLTGGVEPQAPGPREESAAPMISQGNANSAGAAPTEGI